MALLDRLENDRSLSAFAGQFVPVKLVTDNNPEWAKWSRKYSVDGNGIPQLYVVRADGEQIYGGVGSLSGDKLPQMLMMSLKRSGRVFNNAEADLLTGAVTEARAALEREDLLAAAVSLSTTNQLGSPDGLGSYAQAAIDAAEVYAEIQARIEADISKAKQQLSDPDSKDTLDSAILLSQADAAYKLFPNLRRNVGVTREFRKDERLAEAFAQADALLKARALRASPNPRIKSRATRAYLDVMRRFPKSDADTLARDEVKAIAPKLDLPDPNEMPQDVTESPNKADGFRTWTTRSGTFRTSAKYLQRNADKVQLLKRDGTKIVVEISMLSSEDQEFLRQQD